jgi:ABC-type transport system involved in cytochrome c biogenesis permease component
VALSSIEWQDTRVALAIVVLATVLLLLGYRFPHWITVAATAVVAIPALLLVSAAQQTSGGGGEEPSVLWSLVFLPFPPLAVAAGGVLRRWPRKGRASRPSEVRRDRHG